jgi:transcriptional regulator with XRE-family HTH domain
MDLAMAQQLVDRRKAAWLSQEALAAQLGVSRQAVSKWERSESSPDTDNLIALAALYGVSLDELLYGEAVDSTDDSQTDDEAQNSNAGTVTIDGETFSSWKEAHDKLDHHGKHFHTKVGRAWNKFPFPALVALAYLVLGIVYGTWGMGLFLVFLVPVYYAIGDFIDRRHLSKLIEAIYPAAAIAWFLYMWLCLGQPHPAWIILITIPVIKALMRWCRKQWKHRKQA